MNKTTETKSESVPDKVGNYAEEKIASLGESLESANEKAAELKDRAEAGYRAKVSPAIDSAQVEVASASRYMQEATVEDYLADLKAFASRHPLINTTVSILLGWKLGRAFVIKSSTK